MGDTASRVVSTVLYQDSQGVSGSSMHRIIVLLRLSKAALLLLLLLLPPRSFL